ncbi:MAG: molybdopterin biosynthesis protein [Firmicutes bacterium]|nr:molybdopterin biosynthesis protein [Bacillota bacterium]
MKRNLYLKTTPVEEALAKYMEALQQAGALQPQTEVIDVCDSLGRRTAGPVFARCCSPLFNASAMDGIAVRAADTKGADESRPKRLKLDLDYKIVDTGDPIKAPFDAVIMAEDVVEIDEETVEIRASVPGWNHVRPIGEDIAVGEMILQTGHMIRPVDIGVLLASGNLQVEVCRKPRVGILPTGTEIIKPSAMPKEGDIIDSNSGMFAAMVEEAGGVPERLDIVEDDYEKIKETVLRQLKTQDMVLINAGSSAGTEDYTVHVLREIGQVIIHGVAMKPGKPVILAIAGGKPVIGLPGYPVSAWLAFENFATPVLRALGGDTAVAAAAAVSTAVGSAAGTAARPPVSATGSRTVQAVISRRIVSSLKHREYVRVKIGKVGDKLVAAPLARGAGAAMSLVRADGFCVIPQNSEGCEAGEAVEVCLYKDLEEIENTLVSIGSHDLILDLIGDRMAAGNGGFHMSSTHVGSMGGLMALQRRETTIAPTHLLNEADGVYNTAILRQMFPEGTMALIKGVDRMQGIMVKKGNPLGIKGIEDLIRVRYVNRQRGAGTRVLLDYMLKQAGIRPEDIDGYEKEAATHMAVAALVASDEIDAGMGVQSAASAMGLDFIEVGPEEYDFAIYREDLKLPQVQAFLEILKSREFHEKLKEMGGYGWRQAGHIELI